MKIINTTDVKIGNLIDAIQETRDDIHRYMDSDIPRHVDETYARTFCTSASYAIMKNGTIAGMVIIDGEYQNRNNISYWCRPKFQKQGLITAALKMILSKHKEPLVAVAYNDNAASIRVMEKVGFERGWSLVAIRGKATAYTIN